MTENASSCVMSMAQWKVSAAGTGRKRDRDAPSGAESAMIADKLARVHARIASACAAAGRPVESVTLLAVSKTFDADAVAAAHAAGQRLFGENYVQEALAKIAALADLVPHPEWHLIGPLQTNKTRVVAETFDWVHAIDRLQVAERLSAQRPPTLAPLSVCVQVNVSGEAKQERRRAARRSRHSPTRSRLCRAFACAA